MTPTPEDREAAARVWGQNLLRGDPCPDWLIQTFMRHRLAAEERGKRVARIEELKALADAEQAYRKAHDLYGGGDIRTGRAWDAMRRAGDAARQALAALEGK